MDFYANGKKSIQRANGKVRICTHIQFSSCYDPCWKTVEMNSWHKEQRVSRILCFNILQRTTSCVILWTKSGVKGLPRVS